MKNYLWREDALKNFEQLLEQSSASVASKMRDEFSKSLNLVRQFPEIGSPYGGRGSNVRKLSGKNYVLFTIFCSNNDTIEIVGFFPQRTNYSPIIEMIIE